VLVERPMLAYVSKLLLLVRSRLRSQARVEAENLVLRQHVLIPSQGWSRACSNLAGRIARTRATQPGPQGGIQWRSGCPIRRSSRLAHILIARVSELTSRSQTRDRRSTRDTSREYIIRLAVPNAGGSAGGTGETRKDILGLGGDLIGCLATAARNL